MALVQKRQKRKVGRQLTTKQLNFCKEIALGKSQAEAYRSAYDTQGKPQTVSQRAWELMQRDDIKAKVESLIERQEQNMVRSNVSRKQNVIEKLEHFMEHAQPSDSQKLRATELLGKTLGLFKDVQVNEDSTEDPDELRQQLRERLAAILGGDTTEH